MSLDQKVYSHQQKTFLQKRFSEKNLNFSVPANKDQLKSFLGMASFYKNFTENFSILMAPLPHLAEIKVEFLWTNDSNFL